MRAIAPFEAFPKRISGAVPVRALYWAANVSAIGARTVSEYTTTGDFCKVRNPSPPFHWRSSGAVNGLGLADAFFAEENAGERNAIIANARVGRLGFMVVWTGTVNNSALQPMESMRRTTKLGKYFLLERLNWILVGGKGKMGLELLELIGIIGIMGGIGGGFLRKCEFSGGGFGIFFKWKRCF